MRSSVLGLFVISLLLLIAPPAAAQSPNVETIEGPGSGEKTTLTKTPHQIGEGLSARALGVQGTDSTRWALSLIGAAADDSISLSYGDESLPILRIDRPEDGFGPTRVYVTQEAFLTIAETETVTLTVGDVSTSLPDALRREMRKVFEIVT